MADIKKEYERWLANATIDADVAAELKTLDDTKIEDAFYRDLAFGTGGLRGVIGAGTNRMNIYTVAKASQGLADYLKKNFEMPSVAIGYDSRIKSDVFAKVAAGVFAANGVKVNIWPVLMPVPTVSFATRYLHTSAGVMVTASHNPSKYNGYKVYGADGCQITTEVAAEILAEIEKLDIFADVKTSDFEAGVANGSMYAEKSWGSYTVIDVQPGSMTVKISMRAGEHMTYHMHNYREEVWTVVSGKGKAVVDGMEQVLRTGDVITIAAGCKHTVEAITALDMIEVQLGDEISVADKIKFPMV